MNHLRKRGRQLKPPLQRSDKMTATTNQRYSTTFGSPRSGSLNLISPSCASSKQEFERQARSNIQVIAYIGEHLRRSGGKRVRPRSDDSFELCSWRRRLRNESSIRMATVMEFLHTATLVHDDVIDKADTRRIAPRKSIPEFWAIRRSSDGVIGCTCQRSRPVWLNVRCRFSTF
jgi:hypothetical protein